MHKFLSLTFDTHNELKQMRALGISREQCAVWLAAKGIVVSPRTVDKWVSQEVRDVDNLESSNSRTSQTVAQDKELSRVRIELQQYKNLYKEVLKQVRGTDEIIATIRDFATIIPSVRVRYQEPVVATTSFQTAVAPLCDTHIGEYVDSEQMGGLNAYDMDIFNRRLVGWADQIINLVTLRRTYAPISRLVVPMLGDMISGDIHLELTKTNVDNVMNQMIRGAHLIAQALVTLAPHFERIDVPCVVGNHGRMVVKPAAKDKYVDWDYLLYQWIAAFCREQENIHFAIPKSFLHVFDVEGKKVLIMHGDSIKMWQGIPYYGILRAISQLRQTLQFRRGLEEDLTALQNNKDEKDVLQLLASYFDYVLIGHFHRQDELDIGTGEAIICACMKGGDEYSFGRLHTISKPKQILLYWHPKYGLIGKDVIYLEKYDYADKMFRDVLPNVWITSNL